MRYTQRTAEPLADGGKILRLQKANDTICSLPTMLCVRVFVGTRAMRGPCVRVSQASVLRCSDAVHLVRAVSSPAAVLAACRQPTCSL